MRGTTAAPSKTERNPALTAAAVLLFMDAALALLGYVLKHPVLASFGPPLIGFEVLIGLLLLRGGKVVRIGAFLWILLFTAIFTQGYLGGYLRGGAPLSLANMPLLWLQILFRGSFLVLLLGGFGKICTRVSAAIGGFALLAFVGVALGGNPFGPQAAMRKALRAAALPGNHYVSPTKSFEISVPNQDWTLVKAPSDLIPNPLAEVGLVHRNLEGTMAYVIAEQLPRGAAVPTVQAVKDLALTLVRGNYSDVTVQSEQNVQVGRWPGIVVSCQAEKGPLHLHCLALYVVASPYVYQVGAFAEESKFATYEADLRAIIDSFKIRGQKEPAQGPTR